MKIIFLGAPGAGKGTQAEIVSEKFDIPAISTGAIIREAIKSETEMGIEAKKFIEAGELIADNVICHTQTIISVFILSLLYRTFVAVEKEFRKLFCYCLHIL